MRHICPGSQARLKNSASLHDVRNSAYSRTEKNNFKIDLFDPKLQVAIFHLLFKFLKQCL